MTEDERPCSYCDGTGVVPTARTSWPDTYRCIYCDNQRPVDQRCTCISDRLGL